MIRIETISIFLASPGDVQTERKLAREVIEDINRTVGKEKGVRLDISGWDTDAYPSFGGDAQSIINRQIADMKKYDLFVGIMWNRFGQPTPRAGSGTEEEFDLAVDAFNQNGQPNIMFYFSQTPFNPASVQDAEQKIKVLQFKSKVQNRGGLTWDYSDSQDFRNVFHKHLLNWLVERTVTAPEPPSISVSTDVETTKTTILTTPIAKVPERISDSGMWIMLGENFYEAEEVEEKNHKSITVQISPKNTAEDSSLKALQNHTHNHNNELIPYSHQNFAGIAKIISATRLSKAGKMLWTVDLLLVESGNNLQNEFSINNITPDQIATLRAKLLLLNENPPEKESYLLNSLPHSLLLSARHINTHQKNQEGIFPALWRQFKGQTEFFLPLARLWAVYQLITSKTCKHILELTLGPLQDNKLQINFRGRRHKRYSYEESAIIEVKGECNLSE